jgi:hypothetical protein
MKIQTAKPTKPKQQNPNTNIKANMEPKQELHTCRKPIEKPQYR